MALISNISETDIRLLPVDEAALKGISKGHFASRELYRLRLLAEHASTIIVIFGYMLEMMSLSTT